MRFSTTPSRSVLIRIRVIIHSFRQDPSAVTVITIGGGGDTAASTSAGGGPSSPSTSPVVNLPTVLQDRKRRTSSGNNSGQQQQSSSSSGQHQPLGARLSGGGGGGGATALSAHRPDVADVVSSPASPEPRPGSSTAGEDVWKTDLLSWFGNRDAFCMGPHRSGKSKFLKIKFSFHFSFSYYLPFAAAVKKVHLPLRVVPICFL